jgi:GT2 family glycosyltransferase
MLGVVGADVLQRHGIYDDGWCEAAASLRLVPAHAGALLRFGIWLAPDAGAPQRVRFAVQIDLDEPLVFDVPFDTVAQVRVACACEAGRPVVVSMLSDYDRTGSEPDVRRLAFRLFDVALVGDGDGSGGAPAAHAAGAGVLAVADLNAGGVRGTGAPPGAPVTASSGDTEVGSARAAADGSFAIPLSAAVYDGVVRALRVDAPGAGGAVMDVVADPRLRGVARPPLQPRDARGRSRKLGTALVRTPAPSPEAAYVAARKRQPSAAVLDWMRRRGARRFGDATLSVVMPVCDTPAAWLRAAVESVRAQWCANWELLCVDDCSTDPAVLAALRAHAAADPRIRVLSTPRRMGPAAALNIGICAAGGEFVAFLDADDVLEATAVGRVLQAANGAELDLIYSDELVTTEDVECPRALIARPAFSHDYYLGHPYFVHLVACRRSLAMELGGFDESMRVSSDVDFILRFLERARAIAHVPEVLYRSRTHAAQLSREYEDEVTSATLDALDRSVKRIHPGARAEPGLGFHQYRIEWPDPGGDVLIVIPTKNRGDLLEKAISSIEVTCRPGDYRILVIDHASDDERTLRYLRSIEFRHTVTRVDGAFNFSAMNNGAVRAFGARCPFVLFMNNDVEAAQPNWLRRLRSLAGRLDVGAVCPLLLYPGDQPDRYDRVQHAGVLVGFQGAADHAFKSVDAYDADGRRNAGYNCSLNVVRDFSAVTGACLMMRRDVFDAANGFDESLRVGFNDTDLCLRVGELGYKVLYDGHTVLYHHESATRRPANLLVHDEDSRAFVRRWAHVIARGDDFYNPQLAGGGTDHVLVRPSADPGARSARVRRAGFAAVRAQPEEMSV